MVEPHGVLNDLGRESVTFVQRGGSTHAEILVQPLLTCQYLPTPPANGTQYIRLSSIRIVYFRYPPCSMYPLMTATWRSETT